MADQPDPSTLLQRAQTASSTLDAARERMRSEKTVASALDYCHAFMAAKTAREKLPKPRLINKENANA